MGSMSASDAAPLPRLGEVFFDVRGESRTMRLSWYADTGVAVFSIWQGGTCTGTFRLPIADLPRMVEALQRGPHGHDDQVTGEQPGSREPRLPAAPGAAASRGRNWTGDIGTGQATAAVHAPPAGPEVTGYQAGPELTGYQAGPELTGYQAGPEPPGYRRPGDDRLPGRPSRATPPSHPPATGTSRRPATRGTRRPHGRSPATAARPRAGGGDRRPRRRSRPRPARGTATWIWPVIPASTRPGWRQGSPMSTRPSRRRQTSPPRAAPGTAGGSRTRTPPGISTSRRPRICSHEYPGGYQGRPEPGYPGEALAGYQAEPGYLDEEALEPDYPGEYRDYQGYPDELAATEYGPPARPYLEDAPGTDEPFADAPARTGQAARAAPGRALSRFLPLWAATRQWRVRATGTVSPAALTLGQPCPERGG